MITYRRELPSLLKQLGLPKTAAEIGCAEGYNSHELLTNGIEKLYMVDNWGKILGITGDGNNHQDWHDKNYDDAMKRIEPFKENVTVLRGLSVEMADYIEDGTLGLAYVDCNHSYEGVSGDIPAYWSKLVPGGVMAFHDYENPAYGVKQAVKEFAEANGLEIHLIPENKLEDAGALIIKK
ncbi:MAG TPA: class I SAM-dependent methyltransferase [Chitinophagaceae bacterium]|nr:class I SAM-dependent methyltransferase [Chitinophagaceae bacterium]